MKIKAKKIATVILYIGIVFCFFTLLLFCLFNFGLLNVFASTKFDKDKLNYETRKITVFNANNESISPASNYKSVDTKNLQKYVIDAFVSIEDKDFYSHKGLNYKRMIKACLNNLSAFKIKEGASTISQQLIKNTHLTTDKTLKRKFNELILAKEMENKLSKDKIMTAYLNAIYFGGGAFGIEQASQRFFSKDASDLSLCEAATLAGIIKSPSKYSPIYNYESCTKRRNLVLKEMLKDKKISNEEYDSAIKEELKLAPNKSLIGNNSYYSACVAEACKILNLTEKDLMIGDYQIYTYQNPKFQSILEGNIANSKNVIDAENADIANILIDNKTGGITAFCGKSDYNILSLYRQPGSVFKPIIAYAPAIDRDIISPSTQILDEKTNFNGYNPKNYNDVYHGWISAKKALSQSLNIPSIKILDYNGIENSKSFAKNLGLKLTPLDNGYALALGGLTKGIRIKDMASCYQAFANNGKMIDSGFVKEIRCNNGKLIYKHNEIARTVMKDSTAYLITDMLKESVVSGTSKKLKDTAYDIAAKTGTVGVSSSKKGENSDAWNISYTPDVTLCVWIGKTNGEALSKKITGANAPTSIAREFYKSAKLPHSHFEKPKSVVEVEINELELTENNKVMLASTSTPERYKGKALFSISNTPKETSTMFDKIDSFNINVYKNQNGNIEIKFIANGYLWYEIVRQNEDNEKVLATIRNKKGEISYEDDSLKDGNIYNYYVIAHYNSAVDEEDEKTCESNKIKMLIS